MRPFVDPEWLAAHREEVAVADVRWYLDGRDGRAAYEAGHLPGAVYVDLDAHLASHADEALGRHPLPAPEVFAAGMSAAGIGDGTPVVAYDDAGGVIAARLVWLLRALGQPAALLDGGIGTGTLETGPVDAVPATFTPRPWPAQRLAGIDDLHAPGRLLLDAREPDRYAGSVEPVDPRPGHIPGAVNLPARAMLGGDGRLLGADVLREQLDVAGALGTGDVVASCGSGVTACHTLLVLEHLGRPAGRLYPGSFSQWSRTDRPVER